MPELYEHSTYLDEAGVLYKKLIQGLLSTIKFVALMQYSELALPFKQAKNL